MGHAIRVGKMRNSCIILVVKPEWKGVISKNRRTWEDNIKIDGGDLLGFGVV